DRSVGRRADARGVPRRSRDLRESRRRRVPAFAPRSDRDPPLAHLGRHRGTKRTPWDGGSLHRRAVLCGRDGGRRGNEQPALVAGPATTGVVDVDGLNAGYAGDLLEDYLENPDAVPSEWRHLFESGASEIVAANPGLVRLLQTLEADGNGGPAAAPAPPIPLPAAEPVSDELLGGVAAAMALVKAYRMH